MIDSTKPNRPFIVGVAGGSGSGKTYFAKALQRALGQAACTLVYQDNFYIDQSAKFDFDGGSVNFDHPSSIDFTLLASCLKRLKSGEATDIPIYDFATHRRKVEKLVVEPTPVILVDGILIFHFEPVRELFDDLIFFDTPEPLRFSRRLERDVSERGRQAEGVRNQYYKQVKPMHDAYVEPSKVFANVTITDVGEFASALESYLKKIKGLTHLK